MLAAALSLSNTDLSTVESYVSGVKRVLDPVKPDVVVLPAYSALVLGLGIGRLRSGQSFSETYASYIAESAGWSSEYLDLHCRLSNELQIFLAAGTVIEKENNRAYQTGYCFNSGGLVCCVQRQTHLACFERDLHLSRGDSISLFKIGDLWAGLLVGNDARHPEVGRIMALHGADLVLHCGSLEGKQTCWQQAAALWAQVQQNQFFAVEAQLAATVAGSCFGAASAVIAPCEVTIGSTGFLDRGSPGSPLAYAELDREALAKIRTANPLLKHLNPSAYPELYTDRGEKK